MTCAPSEDSDQPGHPHEESLGPDLHIERTAKTDQTGWMPRLIEFFAGRTVYFVGFDVLRLICQNIKTLAQVLFPKFCSQ